MHTWARLFESGFASPGKIANWIIIFSWIKLFSTTYALWLLKLKTGNLTKKYQNWNKNSGLFRVTFIRLWHPCPIHPNWVDSSEALNDLTRFAQRRSALPEVKIREIMIHEPSSFLKRGNNRHESTTFSTHPQSPDQLYFLSLAQIDFRHVESAWNRVHESISG